MTSMIEVEINDALRLGELGRACELSEASRGSWPDDASLAYTAGKAFLRADRPNDAIAAFDQALALRSDRPAWWSWYVAAARRSSRPLSHVEPAIKAACDFPDDADLQLGVAQLTHENGHQAAGALASRALALAPATGAVHRLIGQIALAENRLDEAERAFARSSELTSDPTSLALWGSVLVKLDRVEEAVPVYRKLIAKLPDSARWQLVAGGIFRRAGLDESAHDAFAAARDISRAALPEKFETALRGLDEKDDPLAVPAYLLDWAWDLRPDPNAGSREHWERRARWGARAEELLLNWLVAWPDRLDEIGERIVIDIQRLRASQRSGHGLFLAAAHLGPFFAVPIALQRANIPFRWVASLPRWCDAPIAGALISSLELPGWGVAAECAAALKRGEIVLFAVDGDDRRDIPTRPFAGIDVPRVPFAPTLAWATKASSLFALPSWKDGKIDIDLRPMPSPADAADCEEYGNLWENEYYAQVESGLRAAPENLRCRGGIWARVR